MTLEPEVTKTMGATNCSSVETNSKSRLARPGPVGIAARILVSLAFLAAALLAVRAGGLWLVMAFGLATFGILAGVAAVLRESGCEVNLIRTRLLGKTPIGCFLFGPIDRWEQRRIK